MTQARQSAEQNSAVKVAGQMTSLGYALPAEMARVRDHVMPAFDQLPPESGRLGAALIRTHLDEAAQALAEGDILKILRAHEALKAWTV